MSRSLFDHVRTIQEKNDRSYFDNLSDEDKKTFNVYMINRFLSMNWAYTQIVNTLQMYYGSLTPREVFLFYNEVIPKQRQFNRYIKQNGKSNDALKDAICLIAKYYEISEREAEVYADLFGKNKEQFRHICEQYGMEPKVTEKLIKAL